MSLYFLRELDPQQQRHLLAFNSEVSKEKLAERINSLEDLASLYNNLPKGQLKNEVKQLMDEYVSLANTQNIDIPRTMKKFFTLKDQNQILQNIQLMDQLVDFG